MCDQKARGFITIIGVIFMLCILAACEKKQEIMEDTKIKPPVRSYVVTARIDKKGTNSTSEGTAVLKGTYSEGTKSFSYTLEYQDLEPVSIMLRSGAKGTFGSLVKEMYKKADENSVLLPIKGGFVLTPLQERNLLRGLWFVTINTPVRSPEISGILTLKQQQ